jgi:hypothetical protein
MTISTNISYQLMSMSTGELIEYREELVKLYIGTFIKPYWYAERLKEIDIVIKFKNQNK